MVTRTLLVSIFCGTIACSAAPQSVTTPAAGTKLFAMQSNFWVNLHHFLYVTARARRGLDSTRPAVTRSLGDTVGYGALTASLPH